MISLTKHLLNAVVVAMGKRVPANVNDWRGWPGLATLAIVATEELYRQGWRPDSSAVSLTVGTDGVWAHYHVPGGKTHYSMNIGGESTMASRFVSEYREYVKNAVSSAPATDPCDELAGFPVAEADPEPTFDQRIDAIKTYDKFLDHQGLAPSGESYERVMRHLGLRP